MDPRDHDMPTLLRDLSWAVHRTAPERSGAPLPITEVALLMQITETPGATVGELAEALGVQQPNVSGALRAMDKRGFVERKKDEADRRITRIFLTEAGTREHREVEAAWIGPVRQALSSLPAEDRELLEAAAPAMREFLRAFRARG